MAHESAQSRTLEQLRHLRGGVARQPQEGGHLRHPLPAALFEAAPAALANCGAEASCACHHGQAAPCSAAAVVCREESHSLLYLRVTGSVVCLAQGTVDRRSLQQVAPPSQPEAAGKARCRSSCRPRCQPPPCGSRSLRHRQQAQLYNAWCAGIEEATGGLPHCTHAIAEKGCFCDIYRDANSSN